MYLPKMSSLLSFFKNKSFYLFLLIFVFFVFIFFFWKTSTFEHSKAKVGVNLGGIYLLEDWFYSDSKEEFMVDTDSTKRSGVVRNFYKEADLADRFFGEYDLVYHLKSKYQLSDDQIYTVFQMHRYRYLRDDHMIDPSFRLLFQDLKDKGVRLVRLPITWALVYEDQDYVIKGLDGREVKVTQTSKLVQDPYFEGNKMFSVGIPIKDIKTILELAADLEMEILLDFHSFPGGSSYASYSGTWNQASRFWDNHDLAIENMKTMMSQLCEWLLDSDQSKALDGLHGITPMNEPAHLSGFTSFYHYYPERWALDKKQRIMEVGAVLEQGYLEFKKYNLHQKGKRLVINVIEMASVDFGEDKYLVWKEWWKQVTTADERQTWAALDLHHYEAFNDQYNTTENDVFTRISNRDWNGIYYTLRSSLVEDDELFYCSEFSASIHHNTSLSFASGLRGDKFFSKKLRDLYFKLQLQAIEKNNINAFFWTWDIPYNSNYQQEWSFKRLN